MKIKLELVAHGKPDGRRFLNFWNWRNGNDVTCELIDGKLLLTEYAEGKDYEKSKELTEIITEITIAQFIEMVCERNIDLIEDDKERKIISDLIGEKLKSKTIKD